MKALSEPGQVDLPNAIASFRERARTWNCETIYNLAAHRAVSIT